MIVLDTSTRKLQVILAGAITTNQLPIVANYAVHPQGRPTSTNTQTNGGTAVDVLTGQDSPASVTVNEMSVFNADTVAATVTVRLNDNGTTRILWKGTLQVGDSLLYNNNDGFELTDLNGNVKNNASTTGRLLRAPQVLTAGTTYNPPAGCSAILVEAVGGGGGGGGCSDSAANAACGGGGAAGGYASKYYAAPPAALTYAIGAAGTAGANTGGTGGTGGDTTFTDGVTLVTAKGGLGGVGQTFGTTNVFVLGGAGVVPTNGDINQAGAAGQPGLRISGTVGISGAGANSPFGAGGAGKSAAGAGNAGVNGGGGGGGLDLNGAGAVTGGAGGAGIIRITEFS